jgi:hypothetical protein
LNGAQSVSFGRKPFPVGRRVTRPGLGRLTDRTLYELCRQEPLHNALSAVNAKALLIGRGFATGIERHIKSSGGQGSSMGQLAAHLHKNSTLVDGIISRLSKFQEPLDLDALPVVVREHGKFCKLLAKISRNGNLPASFASKYLHFHCPVVPIYDRLASQQAWRMRSPEGFLAFKRPAEAHEGYYWYSLCFWQVYSGVRALVAKATVRMAEFYLLWLAS